MTVDEGLAAIKGILGSDLFPTAIPRVRNVLEEVRATSVDEDAELPENPYEELSYHWEPADRKAYRVAQQDMLTAGFRKVREEK